MPPGAQRWTFHLSGGRLCLDLANTVSWRRSSEPIERLRDYSDVLEWARQARVITPREARTLAHAAARHPRQATAVLGRVRTLREAIYRVFAALARGQSPSPADFALLDAEFRGALRHLGLVRGPEGFAVTWTARADALTRPLWPVVRSVAELLTSGELGRLRTCPSANCGWIFLDTTRNGTRRWCDMRVCGNRAKARRYQVRHRRSSRS